MSFILEAIRSPAVVKKGKKEALGLQEKQQPASVLVNQEKKWEARPSFSFAGNLSDSIRPTDPDGRICNSDEKQIVEALYTLHRVQQPSFLFLFCIFYFSLASVVVVGRHPSAFGCAGEKKGVVSYLYSRHRLCARRCASNRKWQIIKRNV